MKIKPISKSILIITLILMIVVLSATIGFFFFIKAKAAKVEELHGVIDNEVRLNAALDSFKDVLADTQAQQEIINAYFVDEKNVVGFLEFLESIGREVGARVDISSVTTEEATGEEERDKLNLVINVQGSWTAFMKFTELLETMPYKIEIHEMNTSVSVAEKGNTVWTGSIAIKALMSH